MQKGHRVLSQDELIKSLLKRFDALEKRFDALETKLNGDSPITVAEEVFRKLPEEQQVLFRTIMAIPATDKGAIPKVEKFLQKLAGVPTTKSLTEALRVTLRHFHCKVACPCCGAFASPVWQANAKMSEGGILQYSLRNEETGSYEKHSGDVHLPSLRLKKLPSGKRGVTLS